MHDHDRRPVDDVRMRGFAHRHTVEAALAWLDSQLGPRRTERVPLRMAAGRVLATPVASDVEVPGFDRATMDGYAVVAESTDGASPYNRLPLAVIGDSLPGRPFQGAVAVGQGVRIMTGAPLPPGSDAVLPAEWIDGETRDEPVRQRPRCRLARQECRQSRRGHRPRNHAAPQRAGCCVRRISAS